MGNTITTLKLMEMIPAYEEDKALIRENMINERKNEIPQERESSDKSVKSLMGKELEKISIRDDGKKAVVTTSHQAFFEPK